MQLKNQADPHDPMVIAKIAATSRYLASVVKGAVGLSADDLLSAGWLGYVSAYERGLGHAGCMVRAKGAMLDTMRSWDGTTFVKGKKMTTICSIDEVLDHDPQNERRNRSRLPRIVRRALKSLPERDRAVIYMWTVKGWDSALIAEALGTTKGNSAVLRFRALNKLRAAVGAFA